ncbi:MAG: 16S rRNA (uracil(1498)-N(3))-methyltransferase [Rhodospirillales bacterium]|nr:16S rRNA (uracil(1498)-N(3))-methyltransferase [Rhodospirillales bacterium]
MTPLNTKIRLFVSGPLQAGAAINLDAKQAHYLRSVMRAGPGDQIRLFNGGDGEWLATISDLSKSAAVLGLGEQIRPQSPEPDLWLAFAPVKKARLDFIVEKATELGVARLSPVLTGNTAVSRVNVKRLRAQAVEAAEQCGRLSVPEVTEATALDAIIRDWPAERLLYVMDESGAGQPIAEAFRAHAPGLGPAPCRVEPANGGRDLKDTNPLPAAILTGPEGGFTPSELENLKTLPFVRAVSMGQRILRAETAVVAALACWQALSGDWR